MNLRLRIEVAIAALAVEVSLATAGWWAGLEGGRQAARYRMHLSEAEISAQIGDHRAHAAYVEAAIHADWFSRALHPSWLSEVWSGVAHGLYRSAAAHRSLLRPSTNTTVPMPNGNRQGW